MPSRPPALLAGLVFAALGLCVGLRDFRTLATILLERLDLVGSPRPVPLLWIEGLRGPVGWLEALERPFAGLAVLLFLSSLVLLAKTLAPGVRLRKPAEENPGRGAMAHVDVPLLLRIAVASLFSGALLFCGTLLWRLVSTSAVGAVILSLLLFPLLWLIWGPAGPVSPARPPEGTRTLIWAALAGCAGAPAVIGLFVGRDWLVAAAQAHPPADGRWYGLLAASVVLPVLGGIYLAVIASLLRPRPEPREGWTRPGLTSLAAVLAAVLATVGAEAALRALHQVPGSLAERLGLPTSPLSRYAVVLTPRGRAIMSAVPDNSVGPGGDRIACTGETLASVEQFLRWTEGRSRLTPRAYGHLHDFASLDWQHTRSLELAMRMARAGVALYGPNSPDLEPWGGVRILQERLMSCPITPENRRFLDDLADPKQFKPVTAEDRRWLGEAYLRFGDVKRAREFLPGGNMAAPLTTGIVRGSLTIRGERMANVRIGLLPVAHTRSMFGMRLPVHWRNVLAVTHTDAQGAFEFRNLPGGQYVLVITGGGIGRYGGVAIAEPHPRVIELDTRRPLRDLGDLDLRFERPIGQPGFGPPVTAA